MRTRNYLLPLMTCLAFSSLLCGCGGKDNADDTPSTTDSPTGTTAGKMSQSGGTSGAAISPSLSNPGGANGKDR